MKKALQIVKTILVWAVVLIAVAMMIFTVVSVNTFNRNDRELFGYKAFVVLSDSMSATDFNAGDLIFVKEVDPATLKEGDIITYTSQNTDNFGEVITHKIRTRTVDAEGNPGFITYGTTTGVDDEVIVTYPFINGKYVTHLPKIGQFFQFMRTPQGYIVCIFIPFALLILYQGINCVRLFRRYKKEQVEALEAERAEVDQARQASEQMMKELQELRAQLAAQDIDPAVETPAGDAPAEEASAPAAAPTEEPPAAAPTADDEIDRLRRASEQMMKELQELKAQQAADKAAEDSRDA